MDSQPPPVQPELSFFCHQIDYTVSPSTPPSGKQQWNQRDFLFWHKSNISSTSTVLMEWPWLARMSRTPWAKKVSTIFKTMFSTHLLARFEGKSLLRTFSHNSLDIFQRIASASKSGKVFEKKSMSPHSFSVSGLKTEIAPFVFEHLLDRQESSLKKDKTLLFSIVPQQPGKSLVGICHLEDEHLRKMRKEKNTFERRTLSLAISFVIVLKFQNNQT